MGGGGVTAHPSYLVHHCQQDLKTTTKLYFSINVYCDEKLDWPERHIQKRLTSALECSPPQDLAVKQDPGSQERRGGILEPGPPADRTGAERRVDMRSLVQLRLLGAAAETVTKIFFSFWGVGRRQGG